MRDLTLEQVMQKHSEACANATSYRAEAMSCIDEMKRRLNERNKLTLKDLHPGDIISVNGVEFAIIEICDDELVTHVIGHRSGAKWYANLNVDDWRFIRRP